MADDYKRVVTRARCDFCKEWISSPARNVDWGTVHYKMYLCSGICAIHRLAQKEDNRTFSPYLAHQEPQALPTTWGWVERHHKYPNLHKYERLKYANSSSR